MAIRADDPRPNIIFILTDQQRFDTIGALGFPHVRSPNLDRLVREGVSFAHTYVTAPSCAPSRASLFTGLYPHTNGVFVNNRDVWRHSWVQNLTDAGYYCVNIGKMHTTPWDTPCGFRERYVVENKDRFRRTRWYFDEWDRALKANGVNKPSRADYQQLPDYEERLGAYEWPLEERWHPDFFVGDTALWWIKSQRDRWWGDPKPSLTQPLFLQIGFPGPHPPYDPVKRYTEEYLKQQLPIADPSPESIEAQPQGLQALRRAMLDKNPDGVKHLADPTPSQRQRQRAYYLANVTMIDEKIGEILQVLEDTGFLDNAVVIFASDHGDSLGDHGHSQKWNMYEESVRVPMVFWSSRGLFDEGRSVDDLVQLFDIGPTVVELAEAPIPEHWEAVSLLPYLHGSPDVPRRPYVFSEHARDTYLPTVEFMTMIRDNRWKLVHFAGESEGQLFDLQEDPLEFTDLWSSEVHARKKEELLAAIREWLVSSNVRTHNWLQEYR